MKGIGIYSKIVSIMISYNIPKHSPSSLIYNSSDVGNNYNIYHIMIATSQNYLI